MNLSLRMPALFLGHGSPMNALEDTPCRREWQSLAARMPRPAAILVISAHWQTQGIAVTGAEHPETIHDFYGFPAALHQMTYPAPGSPALARRVQQLLLPHDVHIDPVRGLDHGTWAVLAPMYPDASIPVVQLSLPVGKQGAWHYALAQQLLPLRDEGVLIVGSGDVVHNLGLFNFSMAEPYPWAALFQAEVNRHILSGDHEALLNPLQLGPAARLAIPSEEHYLPLLYVLGVKGQGEPVTLFNDVVMASLSMTSVRVGQLAA